MFRARASLLLLLLDGCGAGCRGTLRVGPAPAALLVMPTLVNGVGAAPSLHASTKPHSNPNPFSRNATSLHFGAGSSRAHVIWGGVFEAQPAGGGHMAGNSGVPAPWQPGTASKCQAAPAGSQHRGTPPRTALPLLIPGHWAQGHGGGLVPPLFRVPSEMGWAGGTWLGCLGFGVAVVLCYACSVAVLAADANLVPSPKCPTGGTRIDVVVPQPLSPIPPRRAVLMCGTSVAPPGS